MKHHREFEIPWFGLKDGLHEYQFEITDAVMANIGQDYDGIANIVAQVGLKLDKHNGFLQLHFDIDGTAEVICDRCGDPYPLQLWDEFDLIVKFTSDDEAADDDESEDADIVFLPRTETILDVSEWIAEFVILSVPMQHIHPDLEDGSSGCNPEALRLLDKMRVQEDAKKNIWTGLDQFKNLEDDPQEKN
jgi:uncharacterized metal-binding protein YceD (DUF177 family)